MDYASMEKLFVEELIEADNVFIIEKGSNSIILSAPHSVKQIRDGSIKIGEYRTGLLVKKLKEMTDAHIIYKTSCRQDDANYDEKCIYKDTLSKYISDNNIKYLLDFHISAPSRLYDIDIGTGYGENIHGHKDFLNIVVEEFQKEYEKVLIDDTFPASYIHTVSATIARKNQIPCLQIELNWKQLDEFAKLDDLLSCIIRIIKRLEGYSGVA